MQRTRYSIDGQIIIHTGIDPWTGEPFTRRYYCPSQGGYVRMDTTGDRPGTLGDQPRYDDGSTWTARDIAHLGRIIRAEWRRERAAYQRD